MKSSIWIEGLRLKTAFLYECEKREEMKEPKISRRGFLKTLAVSGALTGISAGKPAQKSAALRTIDRAALVNRHSPVLRKLEPLSPLSVGNGEFAFTSDITGLQSFPQEYENQMPLCTMSQWGWHRSPPAPGLDPQALRLTQYDTHGRSVGYATSSEGQTQLYNWLRENPHRLHLGQIGLRLMTTKRREAQAADITDIEQKLDLWTGALTSRFKFEGNPVMVRTAVHPSLDLLAVTIESRLIDEGRLGVRFAFPYGSPGMQAADWQKPDKHKTERTRQKSNDIEIHRQLDSDEYFLIINWAGQASFAEERAHTFLLTPARQTSRLEFVAAFSPHHSKKSLPTAALTFVESAKHWQRFWTQGGAIELAHSRDKRAIELERRVVLSQYLTAIQCAGSRPPQETGLTVNSWYGKFHLEMHWWHAAHFALWDRLHLLEKSLGWYDSILPGARNLAKAQGYKGARWPKMVGPEGLDSPSPIGPLLIWQQPHPIFYAELCYLSQRARGTRRVLERYQRIVFESAEFMASYAFFESKTQRYVLGPPVIPAQENHPPRETWNPTFELAYWAYGLRTAQRWRERLGLQRNPLWDRVINQLSPLPVKDGVYLAHENCPQTFTERNIDHPSMLGALGVLPGDGVDRETMRRTLHLTMKEWQWDKTWGWDYPMTAMTAARLGEPKIALDALLMTTEKNRYLPNGHNWQRANLPCYLPGNGGLLYAVALMAGGWKGAARTPAPGFPADGSWTVRWEKLNTALLKEI
jgi:protein-glucosylgalactosylhydroxylysine glucosidase